MFSIIYKYRDKKDNNLMEFVKTLDKKDNYLLEFVKTLPLSNFG